MSTQKDSAVEQQRLDTVTRKQYIAIVLGIPGMSGEAEFS
jgi:hypothetical protein